MVLRVWGLDWRLLDHKFNDLQVDICDLPWQNQSYCAASDDRFLVKATITITKYNLWTIAPANLKSLARVVMEIWAKMYPDRP